LGGAGAIGAGGTGFARSTAPGIDISGLGFSSAKAMPIAPTKPIITRIRKNLFIFTSIFFTKQLASTIALKIPHQKAPAFDREFPIAFMEVFINFCAKPQAQASTF
jgi:hypothetical protein